MPNAGAASARYLEDFVLSHSDPTTGLPVGPRGARAADPVYTSEQLLAAVLSSVDDDKAEDIVDYTQRENLGLRLAKRFGASVGEGMFVAARAAGIQLK